MRTFLRRLADRLFTSLAGLSVLLMAAAVLLILGPIAWRGGQAVFFRGTVEFRHMQLREFQRGDRQTVLGEVAEAQAARRGVYDLLDRFSRGISIERIGQHTSDAFRQLDAQLDHRQDAGQIASEGARALKRQARRLRQELERIYGLTDRQEALDGLRGVLDSPDRAPLAGTAGEELFRLAEEYKGIIESVDLRRRQEYAEDLRGVQDVLERLLGPQPGGKLPALAQQRYGATRWDQAQKDLDELLWAERWVPAGPGEPLRKVRVARSEVFAGTPLAALFPLVQRDLEKMLLPRRTFYWQFFIDDSTPGHFFGGVGPEIVGTLLLTALCMLMAVPVGVATAAYLVECARESALLRILRTSINTLAGVPSIVFGLFGLAFFVLWLLPEAGLRADRSILAGSLTLAMLVLPIIIRASEEAIRAVPISYKEASLALGAGGLRTFVTVTLPAAMPGVLTGIILAMSRAAGETAPILFTAAVAVGPWPGSLLRPCRTLSYASYDMAVGDRIAPLVPHNQYGMILVLIVLVLVLNIAAIFLRSRLSRRLRGG